MDYFINYKNERYHDNNLIKLMEYISSKGNTSLFSEGLNLELPNVGEYKYSQIKKDYDVHLDFEKAIICIETKVDSCENEYKSKLRYQTQRIYNKYKGMYSRKTFFRYITYGASEFYVKRNEDNLFTVGPYSTGFKHIPLLNIIRMIEYSGVLKESKYHELNEWYFYLNYEYKKREKYLQLLSKINEFRKLYIGNSGLTDWPNNRINICIPEIVLFFYSRIAKEWNVSKFAKKLGGVSVYPVGRLGKVDDAILNFRELWENNTYTLNGLIKYSNALYFEFNEDFNLHLKCKYDSKIENKIDIIRKFIQDHDEKLSIKRKYNSIIESYRQGAYVLYEWDLDILDNINNISKILPIIVEVINSAIQIIK